MFFNVILISQKSMHVNFFTTQEAYYIKLS
ncbi:hypothetical protein YTXLTZUM_CDS0173 [Enterococcus phage VRE9_3]